MGLPRSDWVLPEVHPDDSSIAAPLTDLTKKYAPTRVMWSEACAAAFQKLKEILCKAPVLQNPDCNKSFILQTDASDRGIGAVLSQEDSDGEEHPVACNGGERVSGHQVGDPSISGLFDGQTICGTNRPQITCLAGQTEGEQCSFDPLESSPTTVSVHSETSSREGKQQCQCTFP